MPKPWSLCTLLAISVSLAVVSEAAAGRRRHRGGPSCGAEYGCYDERGGASGPSDGCMENGFTAYGCDGSGCAVSGIEEPWGAEMTMGCNCEVPSEIAYPQYEGGVVPDLYETPGMPMPPAAPQYPLDSQAKTSPNYELRRWMDRSGKYSRVARLLLASRDRARLIAPDGSSYDIQLARLSPADASYVSGLAAQGNAVLNVPGFGPAVVAPQVRGWPEGAGSVAGRLVYSDPRHIQIATGGGRIHTVSRDKLSAEDARYVATGENAAPALANSAGRRRY